VNGTNLIGLINGNLSARIRRIQGLTPVPGREDK
jgi:hypothetical protein